MVVIMHTRKRNDCNAIAIYICYSILYAIFASVKQTLHLNYAHKRNSVDELPSKLYTVCFRFAQLKMKHR